MPWTKHEEAPSPQATGDALLRALDPSDRSAILGLSRHVASRAANTNSKPAELLAAAKLHYRGLGLSDVHAPALAVVLRTAPALVELALCYNSLTDDAIGVIAAALPTAKCLQILDLSFNRLEVRGFEELGPALALAPSLERVMLKGNLGLGEGWWGASGRSHLATMLTLVPLSPADGRVRKPKQRSKKAAFRHKFKWAKFMPGALSSEADTSRITLLEVGSGWVQSPDDTLYAVAIFLARGDEMAAAQCVASAALHLSNPIDDCAFVVSSLFRVDPVRAGRIATILATELRAAALEASTMHPLEEQALTELGSAVQLALRACIELMDAQARVREGARDGTEGLRSRTMADRSLSTHFEAYAAQTQERILAQSGGASEVRELLEREDMWAVMEAASESGCAVLLASGLLQQAHTRAFHGHLGDILNHRLPIAYSLFTEAVSFKPTRWVIGESLYFMGLCSMLVCGHLILEPLALVLVILVPATEEPLRRGLVPRDIVSRFFRRRTHDWCGQHFEMRAFVLDPIFRLFASLVADCALALWCVHLPPPRQYVTADGGPSLASWERGSWLPEYYLWPDWRVCVALVWIFSALVGEAQELLSLAPNDIFQASHRYFRQVWNWLDLFGLLLALCALGAHVLVVWGARPAEFWFAFRGLEPAADDAQAFEREARLVQSVLSPAVWALMIRPGRLTLLSPGLGPMTRMVLLMAGDVVIVVLFGTGLSLAAAAGIVVLFKSPLPPLVLGDVDGELLGSAARASFDKVSRLSGSARVLMSKGMGGGDASASGGGEELGGECAESAIAMLFAGGGGDNVASRLFNALLVLTEIWLTGESAALACARNSSQGLGAWWLLFLFSLTTVVCLLNLLIAKMAKTFDVVYEARAVSFLHSRAEIIQRARVMRFAPIPLNLVGLPGRLLVYVWRRAASMLQRGDAELQSLVGRDDGTKHVRLREHSEDAPASPTKGERTPTRERMLAVAERGGSVRQALSAGTDAAESEALVELVLAVVEAQLDDVSVEDRWRVGMLNRIRGWFEDLQLQLAQSTQADARAGGASGGGKSTKWRQSRTGVNAARAFSAQEPRAEIGEPRARAAGIDGTEAATQLRALASAVAELQQGQAAILSLLGAAKNAPVRASSTYRLQQPSDARGPPTASSRTPSPRQLPSALS